MGYLIAICCLALTVAAIIYIGKAWNKAKERRDVFNALRPYAGVMKDDPGPPVWHLLFKD